MSPPPSSLAVSSPAASSVAADHVATALSDMVPHPSIALLQTSSLAGLVQQAIERMILDGQLMPGDKLTEMMIAERMGVSRGPVREAFRMLTETGLVRLEKNRGVFVREIPIDEAVEIYDLRAVMDELAGRRMAENATPTQIKTLRGIVERMDQAVRARDAGAYHGLNLEFHDTMIDYAGNRKMTAIYRRMVKELSLLRRRNLALAEGLPASVAEHRQILKAIAAGDVEAAGRLAYEHVMKSKQHMLAVAGTPVPTSAPNGDR